MSPSSLLQTNARRLLSELRTQGPGRAASLMENSGLDARSATETGNYLERLGLVTAAGPRPSTMLRLRREAGFVAAADIGGTHLRMMLAGFEGTALAQWSTVLENHQSSPDAVCRLIHKGLHAMCRESGVLAGKVLHLTAGAPGITNAETGVVLAAPNLAGWNNIPLRSMLRHELGLAVTVENDTNLAALGEYSRGVAQETDDFVFIALGTGAGAGIMLRGELHRGARWNAGEIGYFGVGGETRKPMRLRKPGQLERIIGGEGVRVLWRERLPVESGPEMTGLLATQIFDRAAGGDAIAVEVLSITAGLLADAIADISLLLDPELVVLGGGVGSHPELCRMTQVQLERHEFTRPEVRSSALGTEAQLYGAIAMSLAGAETLLLD